MKIFVFSEGPKKKIPFATSERIAIEDGVTTIRPWRNGVPSGTNKEIEAAFAEFQRAIEPTGLFPLDDQEVVEFEIDLDSHNRSY